jgi:hypothetical protein
MGIDLAAIGKQAIDIAVERLAVLDFALATDTLLIDHRCREERSDCADIATCTTIERIVVGVVFAAIGWIVIDITPSGLANEASAGRICAHCRSNIIEC